MHTWRAMIAAQGGDLDALLPVAPHIEVVRAPTSGVLRSLDAMAVELPPGVSARAGRSWRHVQSEAGVVLHANPATR